MSIIGDYIKGLSACLDELRQQEAKIEKIADLIFSTYKAGRQLFIMGNGGSASTASHCVLGFEKQSQVEGKPRLKAKSLTDNVALITAWANDKEYTSIFTEQLVNQLEEGDVVIGISASGNSPNVLQAIEYAKRRGATTIGFIGFGGGKLKELVDEYIVLSSGNYGHVEDAQLTLTHILSDMLRERIANE